MELDDSRLAAVDGLVGGVCCGQLCGMALVFRKKARVIEGDALHLPSPLEARVAMKR